MPRNIVTSRPTIQLSVAEAFFASGSLKAGTPSLIASIPVRAVQPAAKARMISQRPSISPVTGISGGTRWVTATGPTRASRTRA